MDQATSTDHEMIDTQQDGNDELYIDRDMNTDYQNVTRDVG